MSVCVARSTWLAFGVSTSGGGMAPADVVVGQSGLSEPMKIQKYKIVAVSGAGVVRLEDGEQVRKRETQLEKGGGNQQ